ncbi:MAG: aldehyde dehydrogenase family protein [Burkholderiaceae bacterium]|nr:aldehyde dehydrogenase family protein [Burkholderiaceae bacterium]
MSDEQREPLPQQRVGLRLLGPPQLHAGGRVHDLAGSDALLIALLAIEGALPRRRAAELLWPDRDPRRANISLRQRLFRLKRAAGRDVVTGDVTLALAPEVAHDLAGLDAALLADADLDAAAATAALMYRNAGQVCLAGTRLLVHESVAGRFVAAMRGYVERLVIGDPRDPATEVGPIIHPRQVERVLGYIERARGAGARVLWGGERHPCGAQYVRPTLLTDVAQDAEIVQNEVFGPVLTLQTFASDDEAVALANGTDYGLGGVCYGEPSHAIALAERVRTGFIWINSFGIRDLAAPFGGIKRSGVGREGGDWSFEFFCDVKDVIVPNQPFRASFSAR